MGETIKKLPGRPSTAPCRVTPLGNDHLAPSAPFYVVWVKSLPTRGI